MSDEARIELTFRLWGAGAPEAFEEYIAHLRGLLPRHRGRFERRVEPVEDSVGAPDAVIVMSFPDPASVDGFLRDPLRGEPSAEELAARAISRSLITDGRRRASPDDAAADVVRLRHDE